MKAAMNMTALAGIKFVKAILFIRTIIAIVKVLAIITLIVVTGLVVRTVFRKLGFTIARVTDAKDTENIIGNRNKGKGA